MEGYEDLVIYGVLLLIVLVLGFGFYWIKNERVAGFLKRILDFIQG